MGLDSFEILKSAIPKSVKKIFKESEWPQESEIKYVVNIVLKYCMLNKKYGALLILLKGNETVSSTHL